MNDSKKSDKKLKNPIFDSKITFMVFYTPINVARDRLDLYCDFQSWHKILPKYKKSTIECSGTPI